MWTGKGGNNTGRGNVGGTFGGSSGRGRNSGRQFNRGGRGRGRNDDPSLTETPMHNLCQFFLRDGNCRYGDKCHNSHALVTMLAMSAHEKPIKCLGLMETETFPRIVTGSVDSSIKVWNIESLTSQGSQEAEYTLPTRGPVQCIEVSGNTLLYSADEPLEGESAGVPIGMVNLVMPGPGQASAVALKRSDEFPYTHSSQVRSFKVVMADGQTYVVSAGADCFIRTWRYNPSMSKFDLISTMEGHIRAVTCLLLQDSHLWSGSMDATLRVWDVGSGSCLGVLRPPTPGYPDRFGHTEAVTCLELVPAAAGVQGSEPFVASGGGDGEVKMWRTGGEYAGGCAHGVIVTALKFFQDAYGGASSLIVGLQDGRVMLRSALTLELLIVVDGSLHKGMPVWAVAALGQSCFTTAGDSGYFVVLRTNAVLAPTSS